MFLSIHSRNSLPKVSLPSQADSDETIQPFNSRISGLQAVARGRVRLYLDSAKPEKEFPMQGSANGLIENASPQKALVTLRSAVEKNPNMSFGRIIEALAKGHPTPYAWLGAVGDEVLAEQIGRLGPIEDSTDDTPATAVLDRIEKEMAASPNSSLGDYLQLMVSVFAAKNPALMPNGNRILLIR